MDILTLLLDHNSTVWTTVSKNKRTPLHTAGTHMQWSIYDVQNLILLSNFNAQYIFISSCDT